MHPQSITLPFDEPRFWAKVDFNGPLPEHYPELGSCWLWIAGKDEWGYGLYRLARRRTVMRAHRFSYEMTYGLIPDGLLVCHVCDRPACVNPMHFRLGTVRDNNHDKELKGRAVHPVPPRGDAHHFRTRPEIVPRGESHSNAKFTEEQVLEIRARYAAGGVTHQELADEFGTSEQTIGKIIRGLLWKHVAGADAPLERHRARGERSGQSDLTEDQVREIRRKYAAGEGSYRTLAAERGVTYLTIRDIIKRRSWAHLGE